MNKNSRKSVLSLVQLILFAVIVGLFFFTCKFSIIDKIPEGEFVTPDIMLKIAIKYAFLILIVLLAIVSVREFIRVCIYVDKKDRFNAFFSNSMTIIALFATLILAYTFLPMFHEYKDKVVIVNRDYYDPNETVVETVTVYQDVNTTPTIPFNVSGTEAVVIDANFGMESFMRDFYNENIPFFMQENRDVYILSNDKIYQFDGNFDNIDYNGLSINVIDDIKDLNYNTIWLFSDSLTRVKENEDGKVRNKNILIYSPVQIDSTDIESYFTVVNGIMVNDIK